jgi:hypothetical protein
MLHRSLIATAFALIAITTSSVPGNAENANIHHRTIVHHVYTYEPPSPYYGAYYGPAYAPAYAPPAPVATLPGAAVCLAFSLIGAC